MPANGKDETDNPREQNIAMFRRYIELENARDYDGLEKLFHPTEFVCHTWFGNHPISPKALTRMLRGLFLVFPDWYMTINEIICADENAVVGRITGRGTQVGEFMKRPPSGQQIAIPLIHTICMADNVITEYRATNPFEDPFSADIVIPDDVQAVRAQQGHDSRLAKRALDATISVGAEETEEGAVLKAMYDSGRLRCQTLLLSNMRRCTMPAAPDSLFCVHHQGHGYGIDGIE